MECAVPSMIKIAERRFHMSPIEPAKKVLEAYSFSGAARWIRKKGAECHSHNLFRGAFTLLEKPARAVLLVMSAGYCEVFINGHFAASISERSYIFDKSYEVFDITPYLVTGKNVAAVVDIDTGEPVRAGFALEICGMEGDALLSSNPAAYSWRCTQDESINTGADYFICGTEERISADKIPLGFAEIDFDDTAWETCEEIGGELLHPPYERFHQSKIHEQTYEARYPVKIPVLARAEEPCGHRFHLIPLGAGVTCAMTAFTLEREESFAFVINGARRGVSLDGVLLESGRTVLLSSGEHFLTVAFSGAVELAIQTQTPLSLASSAHSGAAFSGCLISVPSIRYPWNEYRGKTQTDAKIDAILSAGCFEALPEDVRSALSEIQTSFPDSVMLDILSRSLLLPKDGWIEERVKANCFAAPSECSAGLLHADTLFSEAGKAEALAQEGILYCILDFGVETVGQLELSLDAPEGTVLDIHAFEMIADSGIQYMGPFQTMRYVCREGKQCFRSRRRRGFRYLAVYIYGNKREISIDWIRVRETRYPVHSGSFSCSDEVLCKVYDMSIRTAEVCMLDLYVDCPGYEQNPWTGDARVTGLVNLLNFGAFEFDSQYLRLIAESIEPGLCRVYRTNNPRYQAGMYLPCACFPTYPEGCIPIWSFMWFLQVCDHFDCTGDFRLIADVFPAIQATFERCEKMTDERGLFDMQGAWNLIEWGNNDLSFYGEVTANNVMLSYCLVKAAALARVLGRESLSAHYEKLACRYREAVNRYCWDEKQGAYVDTVRDEYAYRRYAAYMEERGMDKMPYDAFAACSRISVQSNTMALLYDCVPEDRKERAARFLLDNIEKGIYVAGTPANRTPGIPAEAEAPDGYVHIGSPFFLFFALSALYKLGLDSLALKAQRRDWENFLSLGLTTCVENFISGKNWTRSVAHAWSASPAIFLISEVLGIKPVKPGYREFTVSPKTCGLMFAKGSVPTPYGPIEVEWKKGTDGRIAIFCKAPEECKRIE